MFKVEENEKIGDYLSELINRKFESKRQFCKAYIKSDGRVASDEEIRKMANRVSQIIKGRKSIQTYDLPIFTKLLEVSCEEILSAGECFVPNSNHLTNYNVAFSKDKDIWEQYINRDDKIILNSDEYGKTVIDYALKFKNFGFLKYLMDKKYIWFVDANKPYYYLANFGAGTSIERRPYYQMDDLQTKLIEKVELRMQMISLAIQHNDIGILEQLRAREIPSLYQADYFLSRSLDCEIYYNEDMIFQIAQANEQILDYFSEEFEIISMYGSTNKFLFPYMSNLINLLIKQNKEYSEKLLNRLIVHNRNTYKKLKTLIKNAINNQLNFAYIGIKDMKDFKDEITKGVMKLFDICENGKVVRFGDALSRDGIITNIVYTDEKSNEYKINVLIQKLNDSYNKICNIKP
ncbi:MAG: hypothetical protein HFI34_09320 [Lachnospiraceae bacterium]|nr:hypothetical protein [Lachnospiraceae bacterium]